MSILVLFAGMFFSASSHAVPPAAFTLSADASQCNGSSPKIVLSGWGSSGYTTFDLYRNGSLYSPANTGPTFSNTSVTAGTTYTYYVVAKNASGSTTSNTVTVTAPSSCGGTPPGSFSLSNGTPYCNGSSPAVNVNWTASSGVTTYDVYRNGSLYSPVVPSNRTTFNNTANVVAGQTYTYMVVAKNASGSTNSSAISVTVPSSVCPTATPVINGVSPSPVTGSASAQTITVYGTGFVNKPTLTLAWSRNSNYTVPGAQVTFVGSTQVQMAITTSTTADNWTVRVTNPDGRSSDTASFQVVAPQRPDLIVENITFSPAIVTAGTSFAIRFRIRNVGTGTAIPTEARLRLSGDQTLTFNDPPLAPLDVSIPQIPGLQSYDFSGNVTVPANTPPGTYYVGVFADRDNRANQTDLTNDIGMSAAPLVVTGTGIQAPSIVVPPQSTSTIAGGSATFSVTANSPTGSLDYRWRRDGSLIENVNAPVLTLNNISPRQAGLYTVDVSNAGGTVTSLAANFAVAGSTVPIILPPPPPPPPRGTVKCYSGTSSSWGPCNGSSVASNRPTVVITHGWQPGVTYQQEGGLGVPSGWMRWPRLIGQNFGFDK